MLNSKHSNLTCAIVSSGQLSHTKAKYHVYGKCYQLLTNKRKALKLAKQYEGVVTREIAGKEIEIANFFKGSINEY